MENKESQPADGPEPNFKAKPDEKCGPNPLTSNQDEKDGPEPGLKSKLVEFFSQNPKTSDKDKRDSPEPHIDSKLLKYFDSNLSDQDKKDGPESDLKSKLIKFFVPNPSDDKKKDGPESDLKTKLVKFFSPNSQSSDQNEKDGPVPDLKSKFLKFFVPNSSDQDEENDNDVTKPVLIDNSDVKTTESIATTPVSMDDLLAKHKQLQQMLAISECLDGIGVESYTLGKRVRSHAATLLTGVTQVLNDLRTDPNCNSDQLQLQNVFLDDAIALVALGTEFDAKFEPWKVGMDNQLNLLNEITVCLDQIQRDTNIAKIVGASGGIVGGAMAIIGIALSPFTFGGSLALTVGGMAVGGTSGVVSIGSRFGGWLHEKNKFKMAEELVKSNESKTLEIIDLMKRIEHLASATKADSQCIKRKHMESTSVDAGQVTISGFKIGANIGRGSVHVMTAIEEPASAVFTASAKFATKTAGIALASLGVIVDVIDLVVTSKNVYEGSISEMAQKLRSEVIKAVEAEVAEITGLQATLLADITTVENEDE